MDWAQILIGDIDWGHVELLGNKTKE